MCLRLKLSCTPAVHNHAYDPLVKLPDTAAQRFGIVLQTLADLDALGTRNCWCQRVLAEWAVVAGCIGDVIVGTIFLQFVQLVGNLGKCEQTIIGRAVKKNTRSGGRVMYTTHCMSFMQLFQSARSVAACAVPGSFKTF
jgi:hypothetical protein